MEQTIYTYCAWVGGVLIVLQVILQLIGIGAEDVDFDGDIDTDVDPGVEGHGNVFFGVLGFKTLSAFAAFFGLTGLITLDTSLTQTGRIAISGVVGFASMFAVFYLMRGLTKLNASGSLDMQNALGKPGTVYLTVPAKGEGQGKVTVEVQGRSIEILAVTEGEAIKTGQRVTVVAVEGGIIKVVPV